LAGSGGSFPSRPEDGDGQRQDDRDGHAHRLAAVDAEIDRTYVSRLERGLENPTVAVLERLARALSASIDEFFKVPRAGEPARRPLKGGRKAKR
jgi:transcriptional regulator with XRE-family HTH domain